MVLLEDICSAFDNDRVICLVSNDFFFLIIQSSPLHNSERDMKMNERQTIARPLLESQDGTQEDLSEQ